MIDLKVSEKKRFKFQLEMSGIQASDLKGSMKLIIDGVEYGFPVKLIDGSAVAEIPALDKITKAELTEGQSLPASLEIIAADTLIVPWKDSFTVRKPIKVEATIVDMKEVLEEITIKPKITITNVKEEKTEPKVDEDCGKDHDKEKKKKKEKTKSKMRKKVFGE